MPLGGLVCEKCHSLIHSEELARISHQANVFEESNDLASARTEWQKALNLLPAEVTQSDWIRSHIQKLDLLAKAGPVEAPKKDWVRKLGPFGPIVLLLAKSKSLLFALFKLKSLLSLGFFMAWYWKLYGPIFGVGFVVLIFAHEMGHYIDIRRRGLPADMPVFLPGFGAYVRWTAMGMTRATRAAVSLAGPLTGLLGALICLFIGHRTGNGIWAALARSSALLNILNLIPVWILDGGMAASALSKLERWVLLTASLVLWMLFREGLLLLVAAGVIYRLFSKDLPPVGAPKIAAYYVAVLAGLTTIVYLAPGKGFLNN